LKSGLRGFIFFVFSFCSLYSFSLTGREKAYLPVLQLDTLPATLNLPWKYTTTDNPAFALPQYNDSAWKTTDPLLSRNQLGTLEFKGFAWFRLKINLGKEIAHGIFSLNISQYGASEFFIDGRKAGTYGNVSFLGDGEVRFNPDNVDIPIAFNDSTVHTLAIRYSNHQFKEQSRWDALHSGMTISINSFHQQFFDLLNRQAGFGFFLLMTGAFLLTLSFIHFFFFVFYRKQKQQIYYSAFTFFYSLLFILPYFNINSFYTDMDLPLRYWTPMVIPFYFIALVGFLNYLIRGKLPVLFWVMLGVGVLLILGFFFKTGRNDILLIILISLVIHQSFRVLKEGRRLKMDGIKIIRIGFVIFYSFVTFLGGVFLLTILGVKFHGLSLHLEGIPGIVLGCLIVICILSVPISISLYLARSFSTLNIHLENKLAEVEILSARTLEQEQEKKKILEEQNNVLELQVTERTQELTERNKDITDSIQYAKHIQDSYLPSAAFAQELLGEYFIFYKPKDIVSGDFYWLEKRPSSDLEPEGAFLAFIAAADCTGHGVPGAMVSIMANDLLNRCVKEFHLTDPGEILNKTRSLLIESFSKSSDTVKDGMDVALCVLDTTRKVIHYAGANNPLWVIRRRSNEVETAYKILATTETHQVMEIKADKMPVGRTDFQADFTTHTIQLHSGDTLYLFSDGYADQFGGVKGKKFKYRSLAELLLANQERSLSEQKIMLSQTMNEWISGYDQIDDMLVIGFRI
jgi:serine phosphatase RsbU (regulator of sigma subunit)